MLDNADAQFGPIPYLSKPTVLGDAHWVLAFWMLDGVAKYPALHWKSPQRLRDGAGLSTYAPLARVGHASSVVQADL